MIDAKCKEGEILKINHFAIVLSLVLCISFTLSGIRVEASDPGWTKDLPAAFSSPAPSAVTNAAPKAAEMSQVEKSTNGGGGSGALGACINEQTILDTTLVQRYQGGVPNPADYWADIIGPDVFETTQMKVIWSGGDVRFEIFTNFPETGYQSGPVLYLPADLAFDLDLDGQWETGVALTDHSPILKGRIYSVPTPSANNWFSADDIFSSQGVGYAGKYDQANPKTPFVWMKSGTLLGNAQITWTSLVGPTAYRVDVLLAGVNTSGKWNKFDVLWGTANCANDVITGQATKPCADRVPSMNEWSTLITGLLILGSGIWILIRKRAA
jgi:hypothetical protein